MVQPLIGEAADEITILIKKCSKETEIIQYMDVFLKSLKLINFHMQYVFKYPQNCNGKILLHA